MVGVYVCIEFRWEKAQVYIVSGLSKHCNSSYWLAYKVWICVAVPAYKVWICVGELAYNEWICVVWLAYKVWICVVWLAYKVWICVLLG